MYDPAGNVTAVTDAAAKTTTTAYDADNRVLSVTDRNGQTSYNNYDPAGNRTVSVDARRQPTFYAYDPLNRQTGVMDPTGAVGTSLYDPAGRMTASIDPRGDTTTYQYDIADRRTLVIDAAGDKTTTLYDNAGNVTAVTDATGRTTTTQYDSVNRATTVQDADAKISTYAYDDAGRATAVTDPDGHTTTTAFDAADRATAVTDGNGHTTTTLYDNGDHVTNVIDADGNKTTYAYDPAGYKTAEVDPLGNTFTYQYDGDGRTTLTTDPLGRTVADAYDGEGRVTQEVWSVGGTAVNTFTYQYDGDGNRTLAANALGTYTYAFDGDGRATVVTDPFGLTQTYSYDQAGNATQVVDSLGGVVTSVYDLVNRLTERQFSDGRAQLAYTLGYTARGELASVQRFSDAAATQPVGASSYVYDPVAGLATSITHYSGGTVALPYSGTALASYVYSYDPAHLLQTQRIDGGATTTFAYDRANELTQDGYGSYAWDPAGNRTNAGFSLGTNKGNQLATDGTWNYAYDASGDETQKTNIASNETWQYTYDNANRLLTAVDKTSPTGTVIQSVAYKYDALGNLAEEDVTAGGVTTATRFAVDLSGNVWADLDGGNHLQARRFFTDAAVSPVAVANYGGTATVSWYFTDHQGSVMALMSNAGAILGKQVYDGFGNVHTVTGYGLVQDRYAFTGDQWDAVVSQYQTKYRRYDPATQRWLERDPIEFRAGQANLYQDVGNDPTNATDPSGLELLAPWDPRAQRDFGASFFTHAALTVALPAAMAATNAKRAADDLARKVFGDPGYMAPSPEAAAAVYIGTGGQGTPPSDPGALARLEWDALWTFAGWIGKEGPRNPNSVGQPGLAEGMIPFWGSGRAAIDNFQNGEYISGTVNAGLAISDVVLAKSLVSAGGKLALGVAGRLLAKEATEVAVKEAATVAAKEAVEVTAKEGVEAAGKEAVDAGTVTLIGQGDKLAQAAKWIKPQPGVIDVVVHGSPDAFHVLHNGQWVEVNHRTLATLIEKGGQSGTSIRLVSCSSGAAADGIAQDLANKLGMEVVAPTDTLWIHPNGNLTIGKTATANTGQWVKFIPGGP